MADNDYIGNIINSNWNAYNSGFLRQTPSWMRGRMRSADPANMTRFRAPNAGIQQQWGGDNPYPLNTRSVGKQVTGGLIETANRYSEASQAASQFVQQQQQQANTPQLPTAPLPAPSRNAQPYRPTVAPTLPTAPLPAPAPNAQPYQPTVAPNLPSSPLPPPPPNAQPFGAPPQKPAFPAPGTEPLRPPLDPRRQEIASRFEEVRKNRPTAQVAPAFKRGPVDRSWAKPVSVQPQATIAETAQQAPSAVAPAKTRTNKRKSNRGIGSYGQSIIDRDLPK